MRQGAATTAMIRRSQDGGGGGAPLKIGASLPLTGEFSEPGKAAKQGYKVWEAIVNEHGGLLDRDVQMVIKDDASNQNTIVADYNALISQDKVDLLLGTFSSLLNLPACAVAERNQHALRRARGRRPGHLQPRLQVPSSSPSRRRPTNRATCGPTTSPRLPEGQRPDQGRLPDARRPVRAADLRGHRDDPQGSRHRDRLPRDLHGDNANFDSIANAIKSRDADLVVNGTTFEDGVSLIRALLKVNFEPQWLYQTNAPSLGDQYVEGIGAENTEGIFYAVSHSQESDTPGNAEFVAKYQEMFGGEQVPEDAADAYAAAQVMQATVEANKSARSTDQLTLADWLRENEVDTILGPLSWNETAARTASSSSASGRAARPEIVLPEEAATTDDDRAGLAARFQVSHRPAE